MPIGDLVSCILWLSQLSPGSDLSAVKQIWRSSRERNARYGLTGAMVFDGERFCELLEGEAGDLSAICRGLETDPRHADFRLLHVSPAIAPRQHNVWVSGYCDNTELDGFSGDVGLTGFAAVSAFQALLPRCDLST